MNYLRISLLILVALLLGSATRLATSADASQNQSSAVERGYRTGYSDGYNAGTRDTVDSAARDYRNKEDYQRGDRSYNQAWGTIEDYRDGYQQGFEAGYAAGYDRRPFDSTIPTGLKIRGTVNSGPNSGITNPDDNQPASSSPSASTVDNAPVGNTTPIANSLYIARDTILLVELDSTLSTDVSQRGDKFQARVIEPREFAGATVEGRITRIKRAGKVKGTAEMQLSFESIHMPDGRSTGFNADVVELIDTGNSDEAGTVDSEGGVRGKGSTKDDVSKVGASAGVGAVIGAIFGGGKGAAIGAVIGGAAGTGSVMTKRGRDLRLDRGQQMRIRTATEARI